MTAGTKVTDSTATSYDFELTYPDYELDAEASGATLPAFVRTEFAMALTNAHNTNGSLDTTFAGDDPRRWTPVIGGDALTQEVGQSQALVIIAAFAEHGEHGAGLGRTGRPARRHLARPGQRGAMGRRPGCARPRCGTWR